MKKSLLIRQNNELFDKIRVLKGKNAQLVSQISEFNRIVREYDTKITSLEEELALLKSNSIDNLPVISDSHKAIEETNTDDISAEIPEEFNFASDIIGNIIIKAAGYINQLNESDNPNKKELINLILGRTEVAKAEILNIISCEASESAKTELINSQFNETIEYFKSIKEQ